MKNLLKITLLLLTVCTLAACGGKGEDTEGGQDDGTKFTVTATITKTDVGEAGAEDKIEVDVTEGAYASGIYWVNVSSATVITDRDGNSITRDALSVGDEIQIVYSGQVMLSYPAQISAKEIKLIK